MKKAETLVSFEFFMITVFAMVGFSIAFFIWREPFWATLWSIQGQKSIDVDARITDSRVIQRISRSSDPNLSGIVYLPQITLEYRIGEKLIQSKCELGRCFSPQNAFAEIMAVAPVPEVRLLHSDHSYIHWSDEEFYSGIRIDGERSDKISVKVNPNRLSQNNYNVPKPLFKAWLFGLVFFIMGIGTLLGYILPFTRISGTYIFSAATGVVVLSALLAYVIFPVIGPTLPFKEVDDYCLEVKFDKNYDGTQILPYVQKIEKYVE